MSNPKNPNDNIHKMLTRSKRKFGNETVISINEPSKKFKKLIQQEGFYELGCNWDIIEEEFEIYNDNDNDNDIYNYNDRNNDNEKENLSLRMSREPTPYPFSDGEDLLEFKDKSNYNSNMENTEEYYSDTSENLYEELKDITDSEKDNELEEVAEILADFINKNRSDINYNCKDNQSKNRKKLREKIKDESLILGKYNRENKLYYKNLNMKKKKKLIKLENEILKLNSNVEPLRMIILNSDLDIKIKAIAIKKLETLQRMDPCSSEYNKLTNWIDGLVKIPFGKYKELPISISDGNEKITEYIYNSSKLLNDAVFSHSKAKSQILQIVGQWISNPQSKGSVFSIVGPMGNGKTTLVKEGIAKMIGRPFTFISLGGATDSCFLDGHSYTYEGSIPGKIVEILKMSQCMNPVIYFDELDKVSDTPKGQEIINLLIHLTDFSQNSHFMDKYYPEIPIDLSKALFIFSLNDKTKVNPILRDRMYMIETGKLLEEDKIQVSKKYMIPSILKEMGMNEKDIIITDETIKYIIKNYSKEEGVRNLKRVYETLLKKINLFKITDFNNNKYNLELLPIKLEKNITFPLNITEDIVKKLIENKNKNDVPFMMYS